MLAVISKYSTIGFINGKESIFKLTAEAEVKSTKEPEYH